MTRIIYTPDGGSKQVWDVDFDNPEWDLHKAATKQAGCGWVTFMERIRDIDAEAWQALIWVLRRRRETRLAFADVDFPSGLLKEVDIEEDEPASDDQGDEAEAEAEAEESGEA